MKQQQNSKGELRAAFTVQQLRRAQEQVPSGTTGVLIRVTLAIIFMYLIFISYEMLGITGPVFVSVLFLLAFFVPALYQMAIAHRARKLAEERRVKGGLRGTESQAQHQG